MVTQPHLGRALALTLVALAAGCSDPTATSPSAAPSSQTTATTPTASETPADAEAIEIDPATLPVPEDYEASARREITRENYRRWLDDLEKDPALAP